MLYYVKAKTENEARDVAQAMRGRLAFYCPREDHFLVQWHATGEGLTLDSLSALYEAWLDANLPSRAVDELPECGRLSADELIHELHAMGEAENAPLIAWLSAFVLRWHETESRAECALNGHRDSGRGVCAECGEFI